MFDEDKRHGEIEKYTVDNPHPMFGKDPNIANEFGHTVYPKWVDHPTEKYPDDEPSRKARLVGKPIRVIVANRDEESKLLGSIEEVEKKEEAEVKKPKQTAATWPK